MARALGFAMPRATTAAPALCAAHSTKLLAAGWTTETSVNTQLSSGTTTSTSPCSKDGLLLHARSHSIAGSTAVAAPAQRVMRPRAPRSKSWHIDEYCRGEGREHARRGAGVALSSHTTPLGQTMVRDLRGRASLTSETCTGDIGKCWQRRCLGWAGQRPPAVCPWRWTRSGRHSCRTCSWDLSPALLMQCMSPAAWREDLRCTEGSTSWLTAAVRAHVSSGHVDGEGGGGGGGGFLL
jgi:hypothetical protein